MGQVVGVQMNDLLLAHQVEIQVVARLPRSLGVPDRIDVVRAFLVGLYLQTTPMQCAAQPQGDGGLAGGFMGGRKIEKRHTFHFTSFKAKSRLKKSAFLDLPRNRSVRTSASLQYVQVVLRHEFQGMHGDDRGHEGDGDATKAEHGFPDAGRVGVCDAIVETAGLGEPRE